MFDEGDLCFLCLVSICEGGIGFGMWLVIGFVGLVLFFIGLVVDSLICDLFVCIEWFGWFGVGLVVLLVVVLFGFVIWEIGGLMWFNWIDGLWDCFVVVVDDDDVGVVMVGLKDLLIFYWDRFVMV